MTNKKIRTNVCTFLKAFRENNGITQTDFAKALGVTQGLVSKIEAKKMAPNFYVWARFSKKFKIELTEVI